MGIIYTTYESIKWMSKSRNQNGGIVVNISSISALNTFPEWGPVYCATKHAILGFTKSMAVTIFFVRFLFLFQLFSKIEIIILE